MKTKHIGYKKYYLLILPNSKSGKKFSYTNRMKKAIFANLSNANENHFRTIYYADSQEDGICVLFLDIVN